MQKRELRKLISRAATVLVGHGFTERSRGKTLTFIRQRGPFLDTVDMSVTRSGKSLDIVASAWTPAVEPEPPSAEAEIDLAYVGIHAGGPVSRRGIGDTSVWPIDDADALAKTERDLEQAVIGTVLPWFDAIVDGDSYVRACKLGNDGWWVTVPKARREFIRSRIDDAVLGRVAVKPFRIL